MKTLAPPSQPFSLNVGGRLIELSRPLVMGILNLTPDSFYAGSRKQTEEEIRARALEIEGEGGDIIDVGAQSTRPGAEDIGAEAEWERLERGLDIVREACPEAVLSVDTYRASVARRCVERYGAMIVNDVGGGGLDPEMFATVAGLGVPYVLMHIKGTPRDMQLSPVYADLVPEVLGFLSERIERLRLLGQRDIIADPGFGFGKTLAHNCELMRRLADVKQALGLPLLVGVSRKSMVSGVVGGGADGALNGTTALHVLALTRGADILRVHDVKAAKEAVAIVRACS